MELHAFHLRGQLFAQLLVLRFLGSGKIVACAQRVKPDRLKLLELAEQVGDFGKAFKRGRLELCFHLREAEGVVFLLLFGGTGAALAQFIVLLAVDRFFLLDLFFFLESRASGRFGDFAVRFLAVFRQVLGLRFL